MILLTPGNHEELLANYTEQLLSGEVKLVYRFYLDGKFVTDSPPEKVKDVLDAYSPLGKLIIEGYLDVGNTH